jgi:RNA polymerase sigma-70 factor, ECF subfamily
VPEVREDEFPTLYEWTRPRIVAYVLRRTSSPEDAADVVAETYEIAWRRVGDVPAGQSGLLWLYVTARHVLANHQRRLRRRHELTSRLADQLRTVPHRLDPSDGYHHLMQNCLNDLAPDDREVLMLAGWEGLSATEIGQVLGCSATAARIRLHRARGRLKTSMTEHGPQLKQLDARGHTQSGSTGKVPDAQEVVEQ